ncbi:MAG: thioredoxin family protein [Bacteroidota bacterium]
MKGQKINIFLLLFFFVIPGQTFAQKKTAKEIQWLTFEQLKDSMAVKPKKIFIDLYAQWCEPCKMMDKKTFTNKWVIRSLNENYYAVKFDGERKDTIEYNGKKYWFEQVNEKGGANQLALDLGKENGTIRYPTVIILDEKYQLLYRLASYMDATALDEILQQYK